MEFSTRVCFFAALIAYAIAAAITLSGCTVNHAGVELQQCRDLVDSLRLDGQWCERDLRVCEKKLHDHAPPPDEWETR